MTARIDANIQDRKPDFETAPLHPMCYSYTTASDFRKGYYPLFIWCNKCKDDRECIMQMQQADWEERHLCPPKCKHGRSVYRKCFRCKWFGWFK